MYINKNEINHLDIKTMSCDGMDFYDIISGYWGKAQILIPVTGVTCGGTNKYDEESCFSFEYVPVENLVFDFTCGQIYVEYGQYDYYIPQDEAEYQGLIKSPRKGKGVCILHNSGLYGVRYNQRYNRYVLYDNGSWLVDSLCLITYKQANGVTYEVKILELQDLGYSVFRKITLQELWLARLCACKIQHEDFVNEPKNRTLWCYLYLYNRHKDFLRTHDLRWEEKDSLAKHWLNSYGVYEDYTEVYKILVKYCGCAEGKKLDVCSSYLQQQGVSLAYRDWAYKGTFFRYVQQIRKVYETCYRGKWYMKIPYKGLNFVILGKWFKG